MSEEDQLQECLNAMHGEQQQPGAPPSSPVESSVPSVPELEVEAVIGVVQTTPYAGLGRAYHKVGLREIWFPAPYQIACNIENGSTLNVFHTKHCRVERPNRGTIHVSLEFVKRLQSYLETRSTLQDDLTRYLNPTEPQDGDNEDESDEDNSDHDLTRMRHFRVGRKLFRKRARSGQLERGDYIAYLDGYEILDGKKVVRGVKARTYAKAVNWIRERLNQNGYGDAFFCTEYRAPLPDLTDSDDDEFKDDVTEDVLEILN
jgi:hypothetical protein